MDNIREFWGYLISPDKTPAPRLEQLCVGLVRIIRKLEPGPDDKLTPRRLAAFYKSVGGNYSRLFLESEDGSISFMYRTLGCFHSLQPTANAYETPSVPCLTTTGFIRWVTIQILLTPTEQVRFLQRAVQLYDVPRPEGGTFPKTIPDRAFPSKPDEAMEKWYVGIASGLNQEHYARRLKSTTSPHESPQPSEAREKRDGYFVNGDVQGRRTSRTSRFDLLDDDQSGSLTSKRGSSLPKIVAPQPSDRSDRPIRSRSAQREHTSRQRAQTTATSSRPYPESSKHRPDSPSGRRHGSVPVERHHNNPYPGQLVDSRRSSNSGKSPVFGSGSEASSEDSHSGRPYRTRKSDEEKPVKFTALLVPSFLKSKSKRRHSSEPKHRYIEPAPIMPLRPEYYQTKPSRSPGLPISIQAPRQQSRDNVRFNDGIFEDGTRQRSNVDGSIDHHSTRYYEVQPVVGPMPPQSTSAPAPTYGRADGNALAAFGSPSMRESSSGSGAEKKTGSKSRKDGGLGRMNTVTGVKGRQYPDVEPSANNYRNRRKERFSYHGGTLPTIV